MTIGRTTDPIPFSPVANYYYIPSSSEPRLRLIGLPRDGIIGASWCRRLKGKGEEEEEWPRHGQAKGASALFFYAPRWPQTTELNQLKFNPEPGGSRRSPFGHLSCLLSLFTFSLFFSSFLLSRLPLFHPFSALLPIFLPSRAYSIFSIYICIFSYSCKNNIAFRSFLFQNEVKF